MDIRDIALYYIFPLVLILTLLKRLGVPVDRLPAYFQERRRRRRQIENIRKIVQDGRSKILADYPHKDRVMRIDFDIARYNDFITMTSEPRLFITQT